MALLYSSIDSLVGKVKEMVSWKSVLDCFLGLSGVSPVGVLSFFSVGSSMGSSMGGGLVGGGDVMFKIWAELPL